eukprot:scaffold122442_cov69-Phaeocystis_antarctica.AAC.4
MSSYTTNAVPLVSPALPMRICRMAPYFPKISYISSGVILKGKLRTYNARFTSGGSRRLARCLAAMVAAALCAAQNTQRRLGV